MSGSFSANLEVTSWQTAAHRSGLLHPTSQNTELKFYKTYTLLDDELNSHMYELAQKVIALAIGIICVALAVLCIYKGITIPSPSLYFPALLLLGAAGVAFSVILRSNKSVLTCYNNWKTTKTIIELRKEIDDFRINSKSNLKIDINSQLVKPPYNETSPITNYEIQLFKLWIDESTLKMETLAVQAKDLTSRILVFNRQYFEN